MRKEIKHREWKRKRAKEEMTVREEKYKEKTKKEWKK